MPPLHVLIVDEHDVYRAACAALLRTEGFDVTEVALGGDIVRRARALEPNVVLIDAAAPAEWLLEVAQLLRSLPSAPAVVLISSAGPDRLDPCLTELPFLAKADVSAEQLVRTALGGSDEAVSQLESE